MSELGENIKRLKNIMSLPQRSINNAMRELLNVISKLQACAHQEQANIVKSNSNNQLWFPAVEATTATRRQAKVSRISYFKQLDENVSRIRKTAKGRLTQA